MKYYIVNKRMEPLSCFVSNNFTTKHQLRFRTKDCMFFNSEIEAQTMLNHITENCRQQKEARSLRIIQF